MALKQPAGADAQAQSTLLEDKEYPLPPIKMLTPEESWAHFDERVRELLAINADTFIERWHAGRYRDILDDPDHSDIMYLTLLGNIGRSTSGQESRQKRQPLALRRPKTDKSSIVLEADELSEPLLPPPDASTFVYGQQFFDDMVRRRLGISGDEFIRRYYAGRYNDILDDPHHSDLMYLAMLGDLGR
jgi:hypothetical protein